jgi:hypothetical protein
MSAFKARQSRNWISRNAEKPRFSNKAVAWQTDQPGLPHPAGRPEALPPEGLPGSSDRQYTQKLDFQTD